MPKLSKIDEKIYEIACDRQHEAQEDIYGWLHKHIDIQLAPRSLKHMDRSEIIRVEVAVAMLYRLSSYFSNPFTTKADVARWRTATVGLFDRETETEGQADDPEIVAWRENIEQNFKRLEKVLPRNSD